MAAEEKSIGKLTIDITDVEKKINSVNDFLKQIGANINLEDTLTKKISAAVNKLVSEAKRAGMAARDAVGTVGKNNFDGLKSQIENVSKTVTTVEMTIGEKTGKLVGTVTSGFDKAGNAVREFANDMGKITKRTIEVKSGIDEAVTQYKKYIEAMTKVHELEAKGNKGTTAYARAKDDARQAADALKQMSDEIRKAARATDEYKNAKIRQAEIEKAANDEVIAKTNERMRKEEEAAKAAAARVAAKQSLDDEREALDALINLYVKKANLDREAIRAVAAGKTNTANDYLTREQELDAYIAKVKALYPELDKWAKADERVTDAEFKRSVAMTEAKEKAEQISVKGQLEEEKNLLTQLINLYVQKAQAEANLNTAKSNQNGANIQLYEGRVASIQEQINEIAKLNPELNALAQANDRVVEAELRRDAAENQLKANAGEQDLKERERAISNYASKMAEYFNEIAKLKQQMASGKIIEGSNEYKAYADNIQRLKTEVQELGKNLDNAGKASAASSAEVQRAVSNISKATASMSDNQYIATLKQHYFELTQAIKDYNNAKKAGDTTGANSAIAEVSAIMQKVAQIKEAVNQTSRERQVKQEVLNLIRQCESAQRGVNTQTKDQVVQTSDLSSTVNGLVTRYLSLLAVIRLIKQVWGEAVEYVSQYYDKMNEIQIITGKTSEQVSELGETYRQIADDMNVSSLDIADAAVYFTRQGLSAQEIEKRLKNVTMYAKTAKVEFEESAEIITAIVNSMGLVEQEASDGRNATQRVADVLLIVGDNAATSGYEIGQAMQKAAASAGAFGVSFERLSSYIAAVSETTRQEARTIGTAFNTIIARLHQIKQNGYNSEDETKVNDIAKALSKIDVALMDQSGNWRDMEVVLDEIAEKWNDLDGKTKSYIATTMAGVKQQNVFLALMNDMSKGIDGGSRAYELYEKAIKSAGTAEKKYATYKDSVTAAQEKLTVAEEKFYALLQSDTLKWWYDTMTGIVNAITKATKAMSGLNLIIPVVIGLVVTLTVAIINTKNAMAAATGQAVALNVALKTFAMSHPVMLGIMAVATAFALITTAASAASDSVSSADRAAQEAAETAERYEKAVNRFNEAQERLKKAENLQDRSADMFKYFNGEIDGTNANLSDYNGLLDELIEISPTAKTAVENLRDGMITQKEAAEQLNEELEQYIENQKYLKLSTLVEKYKTMTPNEELYPNDNSSGEMYGFETKAAKAENFTYFYGYPQSTEDLLKFAEDYIFRENPADPYGIASGLYFGSILQPELGLELDDLIEQAFGSTALSSGLRDPNMFTEQGKQKLDRLKRIIAERVWQEMFVGQDASSTTAIGQAEQIVRESIDEAIAALADEYGYGAAEADALRDEFYKSIVGEDDQLSFGEYQNYGQKLSELILETMATGFDISNGDIVRNFGKKIFSNMTEEMFNGFFESQISEYETYRPEIIDTIIDQYNQIVAAGFSDAEINGLYEYINDITGNDILGWASAVSHAKAKIRTEIKNAAGYQNENGESLIELLFGDEWNNLDIETLNIIGRLTNIGVSFEYIEKAVKDAKGPEELIKNLKELMTIDLTEPVQSISDIIKEMKSADKEIDKINKIIDSLKKGDAVDFSDLMDLSEAHPEIMAAIGDINQLEAALNNVKNEKSNMIVGNIRSMIMEDETSALNNFMSQNPWYEQYRTEDMKTLSDLSAVSPQVKANVEQYVNSMVGVFLYSTGMIGDVGEEWGKALLSSMFGDANMDLLNRKIIQAEDMIAAGWSDFEGGYATMYSTTFSAGDTSKGAEIEARHNVVVSATPILPDGTVLSPDEFNKYITDLIQRAEGSPEDIMTLDNTDEMGGLHLIAHVSAVTDEQSFEEAINQETILMQIIHSIHELLYDSPETEMSWLEKQVQAAKELEETNWAKSNGYIEQIGEINRALSEGGIEEAYAVWNQYSDKMKEAIVDEYPAIAKAMLQVEKTLKSTNEETRDATKATNALDAALKKSRQYATATHFTSTYNAIKKLEKGTISATEAYDVYQKELDKVVKANEDIIDVQAKMAAKTEYTVSDVSNLAAVLGISAEEIMADFPSAVAMFDELISSTGDLQDAIEALNAAAFIRITGMGEADFSEITDGLYAIQADAQDTIDMLVATGQWEITSVDLPQKAKVWDPKKKIWLTMAEAGKATVLKPKASNPFAKGRGSKTLDKDTNSNKKSGGGGGGGSADNGPTEVEIMLDRMDQTNSIREYQQSYYQAQKNYYNQNGLLQGVIGYSQREIDVLKEQSRELEDNVAQIEKYMDAKRKELASLSTSDERYEEVADDLDKLQKAHQNYTKQLVENKTSVDELTEAIEEQKKKIRQMEIDLRNTILKAIEDREARNEKMFKAEIEMENTILDLIKKRYEKERDQIIENTNLKIDSLNKEKSLLEEQLELRKQQAEEEDKVKQLRQYEAQYQRILADPTRRKEALDLEEKIRDLREEMAWDAAEKEVKAQQDSLDQQIDSLEDYIEYVENYYEDLFEHPKKLIEEMKNVLEMSDAEILEWLKANNEEFARSTENTQLMMIQGWQATLDDIHDIIKTYWEEVEYIIQQGDEYIINFLMENSEEYRKAGKLQAEAYVDEWRKQLENLRKAYQQVATEAASTYSTIAKSTASGKSGGGGGGSGGGGGNDEEIEDVETTSAPYYVYGTNQQNQQTKLQPKYDTFDLAKDAANKALKNGWSNVYISSKAGSSKVVNKPNGNFGPAFAYGGLANFTGPAWLDGSPNMPERILSPYQTQLFETMIEALERMSRISVAGMPNYSNAAASGSSPVSVGDIIVNVDNLDTDDDYEELANKVSEVLMERIGKTAVVGGLRIRAI